VFERARIAVVVPAHNEQRWIVETLRTLPAFVDDIVVVDDGSDDATAALTVQDADRRVTLACHPRNRGVGAALVTGYAIAFERGADVAVVMAGDGQMHPDDLPRLLAPVLRGEADYAKGERLSAGRGPMPLRRWFGNHVLSWLTRRVTGLRIRDAQCGYTALGRACAQRLPLTSLWPRYGYPNDLLGWLAVAGARVREVPVRAIYRGEASGIGWRHALFVVPWVLCRVLLRRLAASGLAGRSTGRARWARRLPVRA
jgi:glycosyltransferase involved in cell wall biosynthesis